MFVSRCGCLLGRREECTSKCSCFLPVHVSLFENLLKNGQSHEKSMTFYPMQCCFGPKKCSVSWNWLFSMRIERKLCKVSLLNKKQNNVPFKLVLFFISLLLNSILYRLFSRARGTQKSGGSATLLFSTRKGGGGTILLNPYAVCYNI